MIPNLAKFCPACGFGQQIVDAAPPAVVPAIAAKPAAPAGPQACSGCGMLRASQRRGCDVCTLSYDQPGRPIPPTGDAVWVGVRCQFQCRLCGHPSPLNHLDMDGSVSCLRCGLDQVFDVESWIEGLEHAMRCGVLAGQRGEYRRIGVTATSLELVQSGMKLGNGNVILRSLRVTAGPGHPPCARCHHPLEVELDGRLTKSRCPQCGATQSCELPDRATQSCAAVCGVIAEELALDRREAKVDDSTSDAAAIKCAHCAAPLKVTGISSIVTCEYCGASSRIPRRTMFKLGHDHPVTQLWWLAFSRRLAATLAPPPPPAPPPKQRREPAARANERAPSRPPATPKPDGLGVLAALAMVIAVGLLGYHDDLSRWVTALRAAAASPSTPASGSGRAPAAVAGPELSAGAVFVDLAGCRCGTTQLRGQLDRDGGSIRLRAMRETHAPVELERFELGTVHALGLGCERDRIVIAAGSRAAAWSLDRGIKAWDRALPAAFRGDRPGDRDVRCAPLKIARGRITIPTGARGATVVKLINGQR